MTKLLTLEEAADRLRTTPEALRRRMQRGDIDHVKDGRRYRMTERQAEEHIKKCSVLRKTHPPRGRYFPRGAGYRGFARTGKIPAKQFLNKGWA